MFSLKVFGGVSLEGPNGPLVGPAARRHQMALLAILATARAGGLSREKLASYLWPETNGERARSLLSNSVYLLRQTLGENAISGNRELLRLNPELVSCDAREFEDALTAGELERAVTLYRGPFLDGFHLADTTTFVEWVEAERERFARSYARTLEALAERREGEGDWKGAADWARKLAVQDPFNSRAALNLMRILNAAGDRAGALQHAQVHTTLLREEFGAEPDSGLVAFAVRLRAESVRQDHAAVGVGKEVVPRGVPPEVVAEQGVIDSESFSAEAPASPALRASAARPRLVRRKIWLPAAVAVSLAALTAIAGGQLRALLFGIPAAAPSAITSLAVLPLENLSRDPDEEFFADGMTDALITEIARYGDLRVISRTSTMQYRNPGKPLPEIARELGVDAIVEGTVLREGNRIRITAQLIHASSDEHLWVESYERDLRDILTLQREIAGTVARQVNARIAQRPFRRAVRSRPIPQPMNCTSRPGTISRKCRAKALGSPSTASSRRSARIRTLRWPMPGWRKLT